MSAMGFCTDCGNWSEVFKGRCGCGSGRIAVPPAGYRILAPGELDGDTLERCAQAVHCGCSNYCDFDEAEDKIRALKGGAG